MNIGHISFRLAGTDGVSLETAKIAKVLNRMGHTNYYFAGELDDDNSEIDSKTIQGKFFSPLAHFSHPEIKWITEHAFGNDISHPDLLLKINDIANLLEKEIRRFIDQYKLHLITTQNVFAIPMNLPLSVALYRVVNEMKIPVINHNHDFYWERGKYKKNCVSDLLKEMFPPKLENVRQVVINSFAKQELEQLGIKSEILPNIFDFDQKPPGIDSYNDDLRQNLRISPDELLFLQPTRVIPRKGIELAIDLVNQLSDIKIKLLITHQAEFDTLDYLEKIKNYANQKKVDLLYLPGKFEPERRVLPNGEKIYSLWDAYIHSDFVTYPSLYEGFGNALLEIIYFKKPFLINRYKVFQADIEPTGIKAVIINEKITDLAVEEVRKLTLHPDLSKMYTEGNYEIAKRFFSYQTARISLEKMIEQFN